MRGSGAEGPFVRGLRSWGNDVTRAVNSLIPAKGTRTDGGFLSLDFERPPVPGAFSGAFASGEAFSTTIPLTLTGGTVYSLFGTDTVADTPIDLPASGDLYVWVQCDFDVAGGLAAHILTGDTFPGLHSSPTRANVLLGYLQDVASAGAVWGWIPVRTGHICLDTLGQLIDLPFIAFFSDGTLYSSVLNLEVNGGAIYNHWTTTGTHPAPWLAAAATIALPSSGDLYVYLQLVFNFGAKTLDGTIVGVADTQDYWSENTLNILLGILEDTGHMGDRHHLIYRWRQHFCGDVQLVDGISEVKAVDRPGGGAPIKLKFGHGAYLGTSSSTTTTTGGTTSTTPGSSTTTPGTTTPGTTTPGTTAGTTTPGTTTTTPGTTTPGTTTPGTTTPGTTTPGTTTPGTTTPGTTTTAGSFDEDLATSVDPRDKITLMIVGFTDTFFACPPAAENLHYEQGGWYGPWAGLLAFGGLNLHSDISVPGMGGSWMLYGSYTRMTIQNARVAVGSWNDDVGHRTAIVLAADGWHFFFQPSLTDPQGGAVFNEYHGIKRTGMHPWGIYEYSDGYDHTASITILPVQVPTPVISPAGGTVNTEVPITITLPYHDGVACYYTVDGSTPTTASTPYTGAFYLSVSCTLKVKAFKTGMGDSAVASVAFTVNGDCTAPLYTPTGGGSFTSTVDVALSCLTPGVTMRYTTDGSDPTSSSTLYTAPITLTSGSWGNYYDLKAKAFKAGLGDSPNAEDYYYVAPPPPDPPIIAPASGSYAGTCHVTITGASPYDYLNWWSSDYSYYGWMNPDSVDIDHSVTIYAQAGWGPYSDLVSKSYTIT